ncbi:MAG: hypothetical protein WKF88_01220 [Ferruginibacter sp.]
MVTITHDDLLQFVYKETSPEKTIRIQQLAESDSDIKERLEVLQSAKTRLEKIKLISPDQRSLDNIFNYAERGVEEMQHGK